MADGPRSRREDAIAAPRARPRRLSVATAPAVASVLSFLLPGLGQAATGAWRRGLLLAVPALLLVGALAAVWIVDRSLFVRAGLTPAVLLVIAGASIVLFVYRAWAILDAYRLGDRLAAGAITSVGRALSLVVLIVLLAVSAYAHGWVAYVGWSAHQTLTAVFDPEGPQGLEPSPSAVASATAPASATPAATPTPTPQPTPSPTPTPDWAVDGRLNVLLIGSDAGPGRWSMRADAIILVSVEIETGRVAAFSLPRYTRGVPLPEPAASAFDCGCLMEDYYNALFVYANEHPDLFPGGELRGFLALSGAAEALFGVRLDGMAVADLNGFVALVDAIGGVTIDAPASVYDATYPNSDGSGPVEIFFPAGVQTLDGWHALAYARTRHQDGDVNRMRRQQAVLGALQREIFCDLLGRLPALLEVARDAVWTNLPLEDVPDMLLIDPGPIEGHVLFDTHNVTLTAADVARIQAEVAGAFDSPAPPPANGGVGC